MPETIQNREFLINLIVFRCGAAHIHELPLTNKYIEFLEDVESVIPLDIRFQIVYLYDRVVESLIA